MAEFTVNAERFDPYRSFLFQVVLDGIVVAGVSKVGSLKRSTEVVKHRDGASPSFQNCSPGLTAHEPVMLERGVTFDPVFHDWANEVWSPEGLGGVSLAGFRKNLNINLLNLQGVVVRSFKIYNAWPSEYVALPELDSNNNAVAIESLTLQNEGWELDPAVVEVAET